VGGDGCGRRARSRLAPAPARRPRPPRDPAYRDARRGRARVAARRPPRALARLGVAAVAGDAAQEEEEALGRGRARRARARRARRAPAAPAAATSRPRHRLPLLPRLLGRPPRRRPPPLWPRGHLRAVRARAPPLGPRGVPLLRAGRHRRRPRLHRVRIESVVRAAAAREEGPARSDARGRARHPRLASLPLARAPHFFEAANSTPVSMFLRSTGMRSATAAASAGVVDPMGNTSATPPRPSRTLDAK